MGYTEIQNLKIQCRLLLKKQILGLSFQERSERSLKITESLKKELTNQTGRWGAFTSMLSEPLIDWPSVNNQIDWHFVMINQDKDQLQFTNNKNTVSVQDLDGICVPGLGFHPNGARLGRGGGYYDRELEHFNKTKIGIAFDFAVSEQLPYESHDVRVDVIVTDQRVIPAA